MRARRGTVNFSTKKRAVNVLSRTIVEKFTYPKNTPQTYIQKIFTQKLIEPEKHKKNKNILRTSEAGDHFISK